MLVEEHLALEVARFDEVAVHEAQMPHPGADERIGDHGAQRPAAAQGDVAVQKLALPGLGDAVEAHLPAVALQRRFLAHGVSWASSPIP